MPLTFGDIEELADSDAYGGNRVLSGLSCAFLLSVIAQYANQQWQWTDGEEEWDDIEAMTSGAELELMTETGEERVLIGTIIAHAGGALPTGYIWCNGQLFDRVDYPDLYAILHSVYIENDDEFRTPDLRGRTAIGEGTGYQLTARDMGDMGGVEEHTLSEAELARHDHTYSVLQPNLEGTIVTGSGYTLMEHQNAPTSSEGSGYAHETMQPWSAIRYLIKAE